MFENKSILITVAQVLLVKSLLVQCWKVFSQRLIVYSRDELKQSQMKSNPAFKNPAIRFFLGDSDRERLYLAMRDVDYVVHAAALKQVPATENIILMNLLNQCQWSNKWLRLRCVLELKWSHSCEPC